MILPGFRGIWKLEDQHLCQAMEKNINWQHFSFRLYEVHWVNKEKKILQQKQIPLADRLKNITSHTEAIQMTQRSFSFHIKNVSKWISRWKKFLYGHQQWKLALKLRNRQHNHIHTHNKEKKKRWHTDTPDSLHYVKNPLLFLQILNESKWKIVGSLSISLLISSICLFNY